MRTTFCLLLVLLISASYAQDLPDFDAPDSLYREDQFYLGVTYNILLRQPEGFSQNKFSSGIVAGVLRDMPINDDRTIAIAAGLGYALQNYNHNIMTKAEDGVPQYNLIEAGSRYDKNKLTLHFVELPIEFRWRTSTPESHKFWRVYTGFKVSYLFHSRSKFSGNEGEFVVKQNDDLNSIRYGVYLAAGYNTWNFYAYYGLNPIYKSGWVAGEPIDLQVLNLGLMFYIL